MFIKLETSMYKILANIETRKKIRMRKALLKFKNNVFVQSHKINNKKKYVVERFRSSIEKMI